MLAADKMLLQANIKQNTVQLKEKELNLHNDNFTAVGTQVRPCLIYVSAHNRTTCRPIARILVCICLLVQVLIDGTATNSCCFQGLGSRRVKVSHLFLGGRACWFCADGTVSR